MPLPDKQGSISWEAEIKEFLIKKPDVYKSKYNKNPFVQNG